MDSCFSSVLSCDFLFMPDYQNFSNFTSNHTEIDKFFTQNHDKCEKLSIADITFHANGKKWYHIHDPLTFKTKIVWCSKYFGEDCTLKIAAWLLSFCSCNCKEEQQVTFWIQAEENVSRLIESTCLRNTTKENVIWITSYPVHMNTKNTTSILTVR